MGSYKEIEGNLITLAKSGTFDVIAHGCNCFCTMGAGIAPQMAYNFGADNLPLEDDVYAGDIDKLGRIDCMGLIDRKKDVHFSDIENAKKGDLVIVNAYTQYGFGRNHEGGSQIPLDYEALTLCMRKMNVVFKGKHIGLPYVIGCGLAGGDEQRVLKIIKEELKDMDITMVQLPQNVKNN